MLKAKREFDKCDLILDSGDYGIGVEITITGFEFTESDELVFTITSRDYDNLPVLTKSFKNMQDNKAYLIISEAESKTLTSDIYSWELAIYHKNKFLMTITQNQDFIVEGSI
jgi:hypothetical protein